MSHILKLLAVSQDSEIHALNLIKINACEFRQGLSPAGIVENESEPKVKFNGREWVARSRIDWRYLNEKPR